MVPERKGGWCHCARACSGPDCLSSLTGSGDTRHKPPSRGLYIVGCPQRIPSLPGATCRRVQGEALIMTPQRPDGCPRRSATDDDQIDAFRAPVGSPTCPDWLPRKDCSLFKGGFALPHDPVSHQPLPRVVNPQRLATPIALATDEVTRRAMAYRGYLVKNIYGTAVRIVL
jgi:hypothetical protein